MGWSIKKPLGGKNSFVNRTIKNPTGLLVGGGIGAVINDMRQNAQNKGAEYEREQQAIADQAAAAQGDLEAMARIEERKRQDLGLKQRGQINAFADEQQTRATDFRRGLAESLTRRGQETFNLMNPAILEDLNSRGLFTSQTARDKSQADALKEIELENQRQLTNFDTQSFNDINDIRGTGLSALLGGDQSALDAALELRKASISRRFDEADAAREQSFAEMMARRQSRDQMIQGLLGGLGSLGTAAILCFDPATLVEMETGEEKEMRDIALGDILSDGGIVVSVRDAVTEGHFFDYKGVKVTGSHAVKEDGKWIRVKESPYATSLDSGGKIRTLGTTTHRIFINGIEFADELETDDFNKISLDDSLKRLNAEMAVA